MAWQWKNMKVIVLLFLERIARLIKSNAYTFYTLLMSFVHQRHLVSCSQASKNALAEFSVISIQYKAVFITPG